MNLHDFALLFELWGLLVLTELDAGFHAPDTWGSALQFGFPCSSTTAENDG